MKPQPRNIIVGTLAFPLIIGALIVGGCAPAVTAQPQLLGLGISRDKVQNILNEFGFAFTSSTIDGQPQTIGISSGGLATVRVIGPDDDVIHVSITTVASATSDDENLANSIYMLSVIKAILPDWSESTDWLLKNIQTAGDKGTTHNSYMSETVQNGIRVKFDSFPADSAVAIVFERLGR